MNQNEVFHCFWCAIPKARKGLLLGVLGSAAIHLAAVAVVSQIAQSPTTAKTQKFHVIDLGTITIEAPRKHAAINAAREL